jgi:hypothetical protein
MEVHDETEGSNKIAELLRAGAPFAAGKLGTSELDAIWFFLARRQNSTAYPYLTHIRRHMCVNAGLWPASDETVDAWARDVIYNYLPEMDVMAAWNPVTPHEERTVLQTICRRAFLCKLRSLEPYYDSCTAWTREIRGKFAVVSPFAVSIGKQWERRAAVWKSKQLWDESAECVPVRAGYGPGLSSSAGAWPASVKDWKHAINHVVEQVILSGARVAIVGCGALSLPICAVLKFAGISAIHMGGATQILFGIRGRRWETHNVISGFFNDAWVVPSLDEIPSGAATVEGGCYWV